MSASRLSIVVRVMLAAALLVTVAAVARFAWSTPPSEVVLPRLAEHPAARHDLVDFRYGPTLRASSSAYAYQHHPAFLVDGVQSPSPTEKWVTEGKDETPWLELRWDHPRTVEEVAMVTAGAFEGNRLTESDYTLRCLGSGERLEVHGNTDARPRHALACTGATGLRIDFAHVRAAPHDLVRLYEVEVFGQ